jgi:hypothetical protein
VSGTIPGPGVALEVFAVRGKGQPQARKRATYATGGDGKW